MILLQPKNRFIYSLTNYLNCSCTMYTSSPFFKWDHAKCIECVFTKNLRLLELFVTKKDNNDDNDDDNENNNRLYPVEDVLPHCKPEKEAFDIITFEKNWQSITRNMCCV